MVQQNYFSDLYPDKISNLSAKSFILRKHRNVLHAAMKYKRTYFLHLLHPLFFWVRMEVK